MALPFNGRDVKEGGVRDGMRSGVEILKNLKDIHNTSKVLPDRGPDNHKNKGSSDGHVQKNIGHQAKRP